MGNGEISSAVKQIIKYLSSLVLDVGFTGSRTTFVTSLLFFFVVKVMGGDVTVL